MNHSRSTINQMDRLFEVLLKTSQATKTNYPRYSLWTTEGWENKKYILDILVAGFSRDELKVSCSDGVLSVAAKQADYGHRNYLEKGFSTKDFEVEFPIANSWRVSSVTLNNGILSIQIEKEIKDEQILEIG